MGRALLTTFTAKTDQFSAQPARNENKEGDEARMLKQAPSHESILQSLISDSKNRIAVTEDVKLNKRDIKVEVLHNQDNQFNGTGEIQLILYRREDPCHDRSEVGTISAHQQTMAMPASQARKADLEARETILGVTEARIAATEALPQSEEGQSDEKGGHIVGERGRSINLDKSCREVIGRPLRNFTKEKYGLEARRNPFCRRKM
jgi:hypothetical protein